MTMVQQVGKVPPSYAFCWGAPTWLITRSAAVLGA